MVQSVSFVDANRDDHAQLESSSSSIWLAYPNRSHLDEKFLASQQKGMDNPSPSRIKLFGLLGTPYCHPWMLPDTGGLANSSRAAICAVVVSDFIPTSA